jgi:HlyD family secretion protein
VVAQDAIENALNVYRQAQAQVEFDEAAIRQREAELKTARVNLDYTDIISPVDGTVVSRSVAIGQTVAASFQTPTLFLIATDLTRMQVDATVTEAAIGEIREGQKATFTVEAFPDRTFTGTVTQVRQAPVSVQNVISYDVVVEAANPELLLKPGMTATTHIVVAERPDVVRVPEQALRFAPGGSARQDADARDKGQVWVLRDGALAQVPVSLGLRDETHVEVTSGDLRSGDRIVTARARPPTQAGSAP